MTQAEAVLAPIGLGRPRPDEVEEPIAGKQSGRAEDQSETGGRGPLRRRVHFHRLIMQSEVEAVHRHHEHIEGENERDGCAAQDHLHGEMSRLMPFRHLSSPSISPCVDGSAVGGVLAATAFYSLCPSITLQP